MPIVWKTYGTSQSVAKTMVQYSGNGGVTWMTAASARGRTRDGTTGPCRPPWRRSGSAGCGCSCALNGGEPRKDASDANFNAGKVLVLAPNGGEAIAGGAPTTITWATSATIRPVAKTYVATSVNAGASWVRTMLDVNPGKYSWTPVRPKAPLTRCKVKVELRDAAGVLLGSDTSDAFFTVRP